MEMTNFIVVSAVLRNTYWSCNLIGPYRFRVISPRNSTLFNRPFLAGRRARAGHETKDSSPHLPVTPVELMRPGIDWNVSCTAGDFEWHLGLFLLREMWFVDCSCKGVCVLQLHFWPYSQVSFLLASHVGVYSSHNLVIITSTAS